MRTACRGISSRCSAACAVHPGEMVQIEYEVRNNGAKAIVGQAIPSYGPKHAAPFVKKLECFCFKQQPLQAGRSASGCRCSS